MRGKILIILALFFTINLVSASIDLGNLSHSINPSYTINTPLEGWVNFSLDNEPGDTLITAFDSNITLQSFLDVNSISCIGANPYECSCFPADCEPAFSTSGSSTSSKSYFVNDFSTKLFGIKLEDNISEITNFRFNISTNAGSSCTNPLLIDLFDDGNIEFKSNNVSDTECLIDDPFGCFILGQAQGTTTIGANPLCQRITVPPARGFNIGARVIGNQSASFIMTFSAGGLEETCTISNVNLGTEISCKVVLENDLQQQSQAEVCISASDGSQNKYSINFEDNNTCGFVEVSGDTIEHDFEIFAKPLKYAAPQKIAFNNDLFEVDTNISVNIYDYVDRRYNSECGLSSGCIIPIKIYSGIDQTIALSELLVDYNVQGLNPAGSEESDFVDIIASPPSFTSGYVKYDLSLANLLTPANYNDTNLELKIGDNTIETNISLIRIPSIKNLLPTRAATLVSTKFFAIISEPGNLTYTWDFGDNSQTITTTENVAEHTYTSLGSYPLTVNITNELGTASRTFTVGVVAPFEAINDTLVDYRARLRSIDDNLFVLPDNIQEGISRVLDTADLKAAVDRIEDKYKLLFETESEELVKLMQQLNELNIPRNFGNSLEIKPSRLAQSSQRLNLDIIGEFGAGNVETSKEDAYHGAINNWMDENLIIDMASKSYSFYFEDGTEQTALSHVTLTLKPKRSITEFFMVIEGDINNIKLLGDYGEREIDEQHFGITFRDLEEGVDTKLEFLYPEKIEILNPPISVSPEFKHLELGFTAGVCNNNGMCDSGETYKNCRVDCKPVGRTITLLIILLIVAFIIYIALQEWYKRNYQKHLFKNSNELFNLITFMSNGVNQKLSKDQIFKQLKQRKWKSEQLSYAWKKLNHKRTGMFEIPILRPLEKRKLKKELAKRKARGYR